MNVPMPDELRTAVGDLRVALGLHSDSAAVRVAIATACKGHGIRVPADVVGPPPGPVPGSKRGKSASKPRR